MDLLHCLPFWVAEHIQRAMGRGKVTMQKFMYISWNQVTGLTKQLKCL